jgi:uncharacterized membrane protein
MFTILRLVHVLTGVFWAGSVFFLVSFMLPTFGAVGPAAGPVQAEMNRRGVFQKLPMIALIAIISGFWMYYLRMQGMSGPPPRELMVLGVGGIAAVIALLIGFIFVRPRQDKMGPLAQAAGALPAGAEKDAKMAEIAGLRGQLNMFARLVATLVGVTVVTMAIARYV